MLKSHRNRPYRTAVIMTVASLAATSVLGVAIVTLNLNTGFWTRVLTTLGFVSLASTGILSCMSALKFPHIKAVSVFGFVFIVLALLTSTYDVWIPTEPPIHDEETVFCLWGFVAAQVSLLFRLGESPRRHWNRWLSMSAVFSIATAILATPMVLGVDSFLNDTVIRIAITCAGIAIAGGIILPGLAQLLPKTGQPTERPRAYHPSIVLSVSQSAVVYQKAAHAQTSAQQVLDSLLLARDGRRSAANVCRP